MRTNSVNSKKQTIVSRELRDVIIFDYITSLRPYGEKAAFGGFFFMSLDYNGLFLRAII